MAVQQDLYAFMLSKLGGEEEVRKEFFQSRITNLAEATISSAREQAKTDGWLDVLDGFTLIELANLINPPSMEESDASTRNKKLTKKEVEELHANILSFLGDNPNSKARAIAKHVGISGNRLGGQLKKLRESGQIVADGERAATTYMLPAKAVAPVKRKKRKN